MKRVCLIVTLMLAAIFVGCSADGGPVGSGIAASSISGNVTEVDVSSAASSGTNAEIQAIPPVRVTIDEVGSVAATTDADGSFQLDGNFSGLITLRFSVGVISVTQSLDVPAGSAVVLEDVQIHPQMVQARTVRQLGFVGAVALKDCETGIILVNDRRPASNQFLVRLLSNTNIVRGNGQPLQCADIHVGDQVLVEGTIQLVDRTVVALNLVVGPPPSVAPQPIQEVRFVGDVTLINCDSAMLLITDVSGQSRLRLSPTSHVVDANNQSLACQDIAVGDHVDGSGTIKIRRPGVIDVATITVTPPTS